MRNLLICALCVSILSGCAGFVKSQISVFHETPQGFSGITYAMVPFKDQEGSLEHKAYEQAVRQELNTKGFRETSLESADVVVFLSYGIDTGREMVSSYPIIGQTGVSSSHTYGTIQSYGSYGTYSGTTTYTPTYGVVGTGVTSHTQYTASSNLMSWTRSASLKAKLRNFMRGRLLAEGRAARCQQCCRR